MNTLSSKDDLYALFDRPDAPPWATYIFVTGTGACFWSKSKPYDTTSGIWKSDDDIFKKIPDVECPQLAGTVVEKWISIKSDSRRIMQSACPECGSLNTFVLASELHPGSLIYTHHCTACAATYVELYSGRFEVSYVTAKEKLANVTYQQTETEVTDGDKDSEDPDF